MKVDSANMIFLHHGGFLKPSNQASIEYVDQLAGGELVRLKDNTERDIKYHASYFTLLGYIYDLLPSNFKTRVPRSKFYIFLKELFGDYEIIKVGELEIKEYKSIAFGRMSQKTFEAYVKHQIPRIYSDVIRPLFKDDERYNQVIEWIEDEMDKILFKLTK